MTGGETETRYRTDLLLIGKAPASAIIALRLSQAHPAIRVIVVDDGDITRQRHWCFHEADLSASQQAWATGLRAHRWLFSHVAFAGLHRRIDLPRWLVTSERLDECLTASGAQVISTGGIAALDQSQVTLAEGATIDAASVIDARPQRGTAKTHVAWEITHALDVRISYPHRLTGPVEIDAAEAGGEPFHVARVLPLAADRLLIGDVTYGHEPAGDAAGQRRRIETYARDKGWRIVEVVAEETTITPLPLRPWSDAESGSTAAAQPFALAPALTHPLIGSPWGAIAEIADRLAALPHLDDGEVRATISAVARDRQHRQAKARAFNAAFMGAKSAAERSAMLSRVYRGPEASIARFATGEPDWMDRLGLGRYRGRPSAGASILFWAPIALLAG